MARASNKCRFVVTALMALAPSRASDASPRALAPPPGPLATPWPAQIECARFDKLELSVDDRYGAVEWRGDDGKSSQVFQVTPFDRPEDARDSLVKASRSFPCGDEESMCLLYPEHADRHLHRELGFYSARATKTLTPDFPVGRLHALVLRRPDQRPAERPHARSLKYGFGSRLILSCADASRPSLHWSCDERSCVLQTFRTNSAVGTDAQWTLPGPFTEEWARGKHSADLERLLGQRPEALRKDAATLSTLVRALADELTRVLDAGCAGAACSARIAALRDTSHRLATSSELRLVGVTAKSARDRESGQRETGWVARMREGDIEAELACARHYHHLSVNNPPHDQCRLGVFARGVRLGDYFPYWFQQVELPDGGGIELRGSVPKMGADQGQAWGKDQIVITGSALATDPR